MSDLDTRKKRASTIIRLLKKAFPDATISLNFSSPLELLVATILAAQSRDDRVNIVTADLFRKYRTCDDYINADPRSLQREIKPCGFFRSKQKAIQGACRIIAEKYGGEVPRTLDDLISLPGVGRKTANVVMGNAFGIASGIVVDTHVTRLSRRLGLTDQKDPEKIEADLLALVPKRSWILFSHLLIFLGRRVCTARNPRCDACPTERPCPSSFLKTGSKPA